jgi:RNA polymerase sigma factor (sigma-70 family)
MDPRERLLEEWKTVETLIAMTCNKRSLIGADADIFATMVKVKLWENDCAIVDRFRAERGAKFRTYLSKVIQNTFSDFCSERLGKWHPSAAALRDGRVAVEIERLVYREQIPLEDALSRLLAQHPDLTRERLLATLATLRVRPSRISTVSLESIGLEIQGTEETDTRVAARERRKLSDRAAGIIRVFLQALPDSDRLLLQYFFESDMQLSQISRMLRIPQKPLYRKRIQLLAALKKAMTAAGITEAEIDDLIGHVSEESDFGLRNEKLRPT